MNNMAQLVGIFGTILFKILNFNFSFITAAATDQSNSQEGTRKTWQLK